MARTIPRVQGNRLLEPGVDVDTPPVLVGTPDWYRWLDTATSFAFITPEGSFTARRERSSSKRGGWYWRAYAHREGKLRHAYLGKTETLTYEHMCAVVSELTQTSPHALSSQNGTSPSVHAHIQKRILQELFHMPETGLVGRERETQTARALLQRPDVRLLTITGPGGVGKTRLALHLCQLLTSEFADGVCRVSLAALSDTSQVIPTLAQALGFVEAGTDPLLVRLTLFLRDKQLLILLDNFEQVIDAAPMLAELLILCSGVKMLVTSREVLHLRIEHEFVVPPLALPDLARLPSHTQMSQYAAIDLFVQRANAAKTDFRLTESNARTIAAICTRLDGLPLAIELAAPRIKLLPPHELFTRLEHRLQVLTNGARDLPVRQQTLRNTLVWSYDLLEPAEQQMFCQLSVFVHGCTLAAAEQLCQALQSSPEQLPVLEGIALLVDKSLLQRVDQADGEVRLIMLETVREFGLVCLEASDQGNATRNAHAHYYLTLAEQAAPQMRKEQQAAWLDRLEQDIDNLRAALSWLYEQGQRELALRLCCALWMFWLVRDRRSEGYQWLERVLASAPEAETTRIRANATYAAGVVADSLGLYERAENWWRESLTLYEGNGDHEGMAATLNQLGLVAARKAPSEAHDYFARSLAMARACNAPYAVADALASLADEASARNDFARARTLLEEGLLLYQQQEDTRSCAYALGSLGLVAANEGNHTEAHELYTRSLALHRAVGDRVGIAFDLIPLGLVTLYRGDYATGHALLEESLAVSQELGNREEVVRYLTLLSEVALFQKGEDRASEETQTSRPLLEESLAIFQEAGSEEGIASRLFSLGYIELSQGNFVAAHKLLEECEVIFRTRKHDVKTATTLYLLGHVKSYMGDYAAARRLIEESVAMARQIDDHLVLSARLCYLGLVQLNEGNVAQAHAHLEESLLYARDSGDQWSVADVSGVMALLYMHEGEYDRAQTLLEESLATLQAHKDRYAVIYRIADLGLLAIRRGDMRKARPLIEKALQRSMQAGNRWFTASCLERLGEVLVEQEQAVKAVQLWGCATTIRTAIGAPLPPIERVPYDHAIARAHQQLSEQVFQTAWQTGLVSTPEHLLPELEDNEHKSELRIPTDNDASHLASSVGRIGELHIPTDNDASHLASSVGRIGELFVSTTRALASPSHTTDLLTERELEVLRLLAGGLTNAQIAARLIISPRTVQTHLRSVYAKIGVTSRSSATRYALEHHL